MDLKLVESIYQATIPSPIGDIFLKYSDDSIIALNFESDSLDKHLLNIENQLFINTKTQLESYFSRTLKQFELKVSPNGTKFQKAVWSEMMKIPFGTTISYQQIAENLGGKEKTRAVASAIAKNPILLLIPCHRVIGSNGKLTGFSGGLNRKRALLDLESNQFVF
jgi:methylated-DNA-[protein]-cysteine S-methyltransferase